MNNLSFTSIIALALLFYSCTSSIQTECDVCTSAKTGDLQLEIGDTNFLFNVWGTPNEDRYLRSGTKLTKKDLQLILDRFDTDETIGKYENLINLVLITTSDFDSSLEVSPKDLKGALIYFYEKSKLTVSLFRYDNTGFIEIEDLKSKPKYISSNHYFTAGNILTDKRFNAIAIFSLEESIPKPRAFGQDYNNILKDYQKKVWAKTKFLE